MRQGNRFDQWVHRSPDGEIYLRLPLEIVHDWEDARYVIWVDNGDGTYTLTPVKEPNP